MTDRSAAPAVYLPRRPGADLFVPVRGLRYHLVAWGDVSLVAPDRPALVLAHGWMDVGSSFQFVVDAMRTDRYVLALDWRGFGLTEAPHADSYWFPDYLGDLDALLDVLLPDQAVDLLGHSMGGNVVMSYAGVRPKRIRRLINMEGFGMPETVPKQAPRRLVQWLDELKAPQSLKTYASLEDVAARLMQNNPRLTPDKAAWLAPHWARLHEDGRWHILGDPAHKRVNPVLYRKDEVLEGWKLIEAPVLWIEGDETDPDKWWGHRYPRSEFESRIVTVPHLQRHRITQCGHMLHFDQPQQVAERLEAFLA